mmetsp:Transcript_23186/g.51502  ORF Transcript_23186/g.51502 Transcript_23186/m.51502 type:complete len:200 (+) Transcript_23186:135-734(+)
MHGAEAVDPPPHLLHARLQLQRQVARVVPGLVQVPPVEPQPLHLRGLPHIAQFALPRPRVLGGVRAQAPALAHPVCCLVRDQLARPAVHGAVACGVHDQVGCQLGAVREQHRVLADLLDGAALEPDGAVADELRGTHIDVVTRPPPEVLQEQTRPVVPEVQQEAGRSEASVEGRIPFLDLFIDWDVEVVHDFEGHRGEY